MTNITKLRKIIQVFHLYGINIFGKRKFDNLYKDLNMDQVFVLALIFELELATHSLINDEDAYSMEAPVQMIAKLVA
jgi:acyl carrier protein